MAVLRPTVLYWSGWGYFCQQHVTTLCGTRDSTEMIGLRLDSSRVAQTGTLHTEQTFRGPSPMSLFCYSKGGKRKWHSFCRVGSSPSLAAMQLWAVTKRLLVGSFLLKCIWLTFEFFFLFFAEFVSFRCVKSYIHSIVTRSILCTAVFQSTSDFNSALL